MQHGRDLAYAAEDLVAPIRSGLKRADWRVHAEAVRTVVDSGGDDHDMARAMGASRRQMLAYAAYVPQFAAELHHCLRIAKIARTDGKTQSITWARRKTTGMRRHGDRAEPAPRFLEEPLAPAQEPLEKTIKQIVMRLAGRPEGFVSEPADPEVMASVQTDPYGEADLRFRAANPDPCQVPDWMRPEDAGECASEVIRIGRGGGDEYSMAKALRVSRKTMLQFAAAVPEFRRALEYARTLARAWWSERVREAVFKDSGLNVGAVWRGYDRITRIDDQGLPRDPMYSACSLRR